MVSTRPRHPKRARSPGFVDPTEINLSGDEDARGPKKRGRRPIAQSLISSFTERSESESASSDLLPASQRRRTKINLMVRNNRTSTRNQRGDFQPQPSEGSEDEEISEEESEESSYGGRRRRRTTNNPAVRRSGRAGRDPRSMAEILEDGIPEVITHKAAPKFVGAKESFKPLPRADDFRLRHCMQCETCGQMGDSPERGMLVSCQGCTFSYHVGCLGSRNNRDHLVTKIGDGDFVLQCRRCVENAWTKEPFAPHHSKCSECYEPGPSCKPFRTRRSQKEEQRDREENKGQDPITIVSSDLINNVKNVLFRCMKCYRAYHLRHLPSREELMFEDEDEEKRGETRFAQYCQDWFCNDCATLTEIIDGIIAWRPKNINTYNGQEVDELPEDEKEYLLKWQQKSYYQATWRDGAWVWGVAHPTMRVSFMKREPNRPKFRTEDAIPEDWLRVEIVFEVKYNNLVTDRIEEVDLARVKEVESARVKYKGLGYEDVVWEEPPDPEYPERWDDFVLAYNEWVRGHYVKRPPSSTLSANLKRARSVDFESKLLLKEQSKALSGGTLMPYQLEGVNWMYYQWIQEKNAILADEMGLGKTIQVIAFLQTLQEKHSCWPFLIVVPNATCANWRREIRLWAPSLRVCTFFGSSKARELSQHYELFPEKRKLGELACHVVVTSYDAAQDPGSQRVFKSVNWQVLVVDEGQRLKNDKNLLYASLSGLKVPFRLLLTGTPLQNNQRELFNLLQFSDTSLNAEALAQKYETITKDNVAELHELIKPFFLRRTKDRVLSLPPLGQVIVPVSMSKFQKEVYKGILEKDTSLLKSIIGLNNQKQPVRGLRNILMQLRKCLCHPYAVDDKIEDRTHEPLISHQRLVEASSKLQLLEIMLPKLKERGHRVLIFSQFLYMLTIIEDFLDGLGLAHSRLDGTMGSLEKQKRIDAYNAEDSPLFAFLLSTRAGGVGINLATADTVIILDPDFNPHQDLQAISRAHRIGQKNKVLVFQFMTRASAEEKIMQIGKKKMALDHVLIEQMEADEADVTDLEAVLRFGTEALFKDDDSQDITYDLASVDQLLDRSQIENTKTDKDDTAESQFSFARVWQNTSGTMREISEELDEEHPTDTDFWGQVIERSYMRKEQEKQQLAETFGRGKRNKKVSIHVSPNPRLGCAHICLEC